MKTLKKTLAILLFALMPLFAPAQDATIPFRMEITHAKTGSGQGQIEAFQLIKDGESSYYLSVGHLGVGDGVVQIQFDPLFELFIPLGDTLDEAIGTMEKMKEYYDKSSDNSFEVEGCLAVAFPTDEMQTVTLVPTRVLLTRYLCFKLVYEGYERNTYVARSNFMSILSGLKFYRTIHPDED